MVKKLDSNAARLKRHKRVRAKISGTPERPRLNVFRSGTTLVSASSMDKGFEGFGGNKEAAGKVGKSIASKALEKGISEVVFDRSGYIYHGRVKELAEAAREGGLKF